MDNQVNAWCLTLYHKSSVTLCSEPHWPKLIKTSIIIHLTMYLDVGISGPLRIRGPSHSFTVTLHSLLRAQFGVKTWENKGLCFKFEICSVQKAISQNEETEEVETTYISIRNNNCWLGFFLFSVCAYCSQSLENRDTGFEFPILGEYTFKGFDLIIQTFHNFSPTCDSKTGRRDAFFPSQI